MPCWASWQIQIFWVSARLWCGVGVCFRGSFKGVCGRLERSRRSALTSAGSSRRSAGRDGGSGGSSSGRGSSRSGIDVRPMRVVPVLLPLQLQPLVPLLRQSGLLSSLVPLGVALRAFFVSSQRQLRGGGAGGRRHSGRLLTPALLPWFLRPSSDWQIRIARGGSWMTCLFVTWRCASSARTSRSPVIFVRAWQRRLATSFGVSLRSRRICSIRLAPPVPLVSAVALSSGCWAFGSCFCGASPATAAAVGARWSAG